MSITEYGRVSGAVKVACLNYLHNAHEMEKLASSNDKECLSHNRVC